MINWHEQKQLERENAGSQHHVTMPAERVGRSVNGHIPSSLQQNPSSEDEGPSLCD
jgi:hypothetical protein